MVNQSLSEKLIQLLLSAECVEDFDYAVKVLVLDRGVPILRQMIENKQNSGYFVGRS